MTWEVITGDCREILPTLPALAYAAVVTDPPYGIGEAAGKNKSRSKLAKARDYGDEDWDNSTQQDAIDQCRRVSRWQVIFGGNYYALPPTTCWLVWDKLNGASDFADCELAWTNLPGAVRRIQWLWNGMVRAGREERWHPTQKPLGVMLWALERLPQGVDTVLDPFCGSGTTGVACLRKGIRFIGIEKSPKWADLARERLRAETEQSTLVARVSGQRALFG